MEKFCNCTKEAETVKTCQGFSVLVLVVTELQQSQTMLKWESRIWRQFSWMEKVACLSIQVYTEEHFIACALAVL